MRQPYTTKADIFSMSIIVWEVVTRVLTGKYMAPYSEHKNLVFDFQIIIQTAKNGLRPTVPAGCPESLKQLMVTCWDRDPEMRYTCPQMIEKFKEIEKEYKENMKDWDDRITVPPSPASSN